MPLNMNLFPTFLDQVTFTRYLQQLDLNKIFNLFLEYQNELSKVSLTVIDFWIELKFQNFSLTFLIIVNELPFTTTLQGLKVLF